MAVFIFLALVACADAFGPEVHFEPRDAGLFLCQPGSKPGSVAESPEMADYWGSAVPGSGPALGTIGLKKWWPLWSPSASQQKPANSGSLELLTGKKVTLLRPSQSIGIRASFGPFSTKQTIPAKYSSSGPVNERVKNKGKPPALPSLNRKTGNFEANLPNLDVTSHLVSVGIRRENPVARILFHIGPHGQHLVNYDAFLTPGHRAEAAGTAGEGPAPLTEMCVTLTAFFSERNESVATSCSLSETEGVCLANLVLPYHWWPSILNLTWANPSATATTAATILATKWNKTPKRVATLAFVVSQTNRGFCSDNHAPARKTAKKVTRIVHETPENRRVVQLQSSVAVGSIQLLQDVYPHRILTVSESSPFRLVMPAVPLYPGSQFYIFALLEPSHTPAPLAILIRIRARSGLKIVDIQPTSSFWQVEWEVNHKHSAALATISRNQTAISGNNRNEELFACLFQVEEDPSYDWTDGGRIIWHWSTRYPESYGAKLPPNLVGQSETVEDDRRKLISAIQVLKDDIQAVVPIAKTRELMNTAILNGRQVGIPLRIFVVSQSGQVADVTLQSSCASADDSILKVSPACTLVYVDGSEIRGSSNATIIVKYGSSMGYAYFTVWVPEMPLEIVVQDAALSPILGWKVPQKDKSESTCRLRFQQTPLEVITKFFAEDHESGRVTYFVSRKTYVYVTDLVQPFLRVSDPRRLILRGTILEGQQLGQTDVQVVSPITSQILGSRSIEMTHERVDIVSIAAKLVSGLQFRLQPDTDCEECHSAEVGVTRQLTAKYQEALLDVTVHFSDGSTSELHQIPAQYYDLSIESTNNSVVTYAPSSHQRTHYPRIIAVGEGQGDLLKVRLDIPSSCQRPAPFPAHPLALALAHVQVNFTRSLMANVLDENRNEAFDHAPQPIPHLKLRSATPPRGNNRPGGSADIFFGKKPASPSQEGERFNPGSITFSEPASADLDNFIGPAISDHSFSLRDDSNQPPTAKVHYYDDVGSPKLYSAVLADLPERSSHAHTSSPMEIAVFILLGVFSIAIFVFVSFCMVFAIRQQKQTREFDDDVTTGSASFPASHRSHAKKSSDAQLETSARDWVWLGKSTLDRPTPSPFHDPTPKPHENPPGGTQSSNPSGETGGKTSVNQMQLHYNLNRVKEAQILPSREAPPPVRPALINSTTYSKKNVRVIQNPSFHPENALRRHSQKHVGVNTNLTPPVGVAKEGLEDNRVSSSIPNVTKRLAAHKAANARYKRFGVVDFADNMLNMPDFHLYTNSWLMSGQMMPRNLQNTEEFAQNLLNANTNGNNMNLYENTRELLRQELDPEQEATTNFVSSPVIQTSDAVDIRQANIIENPRFSTAGTDEQLLHLASASAATTNNNNADILTMDYDQILAFYHQLKEPVMA